MYVSISRRWRISISRVIWFSCVQTLYVMDKDDLFDAFDKAADGNVGAHNGAGKDFSATFTSPPIAIHKGDQVRKLVTKHTYNFPKDYSKLEKMEQCPAPALTSSRCMFFTLFVAAASFACPLQCQGR